jgi:hypothetical protein
VLGTLAERALVGGLADERDDDGLEVVRDRLEPLACALEVGRPEIARPARGSAGGVRQPDAEVEQLPLLVRFEETWREPR